MSEYGSDSGNEDDVEIVDKLTTGKHNKLRVELDASDDDDNTIDPETGKPAEKLILEEIPQGTEGKPKETNGKAEGSEEMPKVVDHPVTPAPKKRKQPTSKNSLSWEYPKPCNHLMFDSLHYAVVDDDRYFDRNNKLFQMPCIVCGDLLAHGKGEYDTTKKDLEENKVVGVKVNGESKGEPNNEDAGIREEMAKVADGKTKKLVEVVSNKNKGFACHNWGIGPGCKAVVCSYCWYKMDAFFSKNDKQGVAAHGRPKRQRVERRNTPPPHLQQD